MDCRYREFIEEYGGTVGIGYMFFCNKNECFIDDNCIACMNCKDREEHSSFKDWFTKLIKRFKK